MANGTRSGTRELQHKLYLAAKRSPARRFHALYDKVHRADVLWRAWSEVAANNGAPGVDGVSITDVEEWGVEGFLDALRAELKSGTYRPLPVRRVSIPKPQGGQRDLGVPAVRDRVVQAAAKLVCEPIFEADFLDCSHGFRPKRSAHQALEAIRVDPVGGRPLSRQWTTDPLRGKGGRGASADGPGRTPHDRVQHQLSLSHGHRVVRTDSSPIRPTPPCVTQDHVVLQIFGCQGAQVERSGKLCGLVGVGVSSSQL